MKAFYLFCFTFLVQIGILQSQEIKQVFSISDTNNFTPTNVIIKPSRFRGKKCIQVKDIDPASNSEIRFVKFMDTTFQNGTIEVELAGQPMQNSVEGARGFVGIAFRINISNTKFECIYLRPTNGRSSEQVRRNHSVQYISYPNFPWQKLRKEFPEKYESYVDLEAGVWTKIKIEVVGTTAKLFVHGASQPTLIVSDLKHGEYLKGSIGLWIGPGTEAHFRNLVVKNN